MQSHKLPTGQTVIITHRRIKLPNALVDNNLHDGGGEERRAPPRRGPLHMVGIPFCKVWRERKDYRVGNDTVGEDLPEISCGCDVWTGCIPVGLRDSPTACGCCCCCCCWSLEPLPLVPATVQHRVTLNLTVVIEYHPRTGETNHTRIILVGQHLRK